MTVVTANVPVTITSGHRASDCYDWISGQLPVTFPTGHGVSECYKWSWGQCLLHLFVWLVAVATVRVVSLYSVWGSGVPLLSEG